MIQQHSYHVQTTPSFSLPHQLDTELVSSIDLTPIPFNSTGQEEVVEKPSKQNPKVKIDAEFDRGNIR